MRKVIQDFLEQSANIKSFEEITPYFEKIMMVYEESNLDKNVLQALTTRFESDVAYLLIHLNKHLKNEKPCKGGIREKIYPSRNIELLLASLIPATADLGIYLSDGFLNQYGGVSFWSEGTFAEYVRESYAPEPQQGANGNTQGTNQDTPPEPKLPTVNGTQREIDVFKNAIEKEYMTLQGEKYVWKLKKKRLLAYLCGRLYCGDHVGRDGLYYKGKDDKLPATEVNKLFSNVNVSNTRDNIKNGKDEAPGGYSKIDELFTQTKQAKTT